MACGLDKKKKKPFFSFVICLYQFAMGEFGEGEELELLAFNCTFRKIVWWVVEIGNSIGEEKLFEGWNDRGYMREDLKTVFRISII